MDDKSQLFLNHIDKDVLNMSVLTVTFTDSKTVISGVLQELFQVHYYFNRYI